MAHNYYPTHLWSNDTRVALSNPAFAAHQKLPAGADPNAPESYAKFSGTEYAPDLISAQALKFVRDNKARPFFLYYPTTVPHLALQVPEDSLREFAGKFPETPYPGGRGYLPHRTPRAAYAAMITRMDREVGRILDLVKELGLDENTIFVFTSDNGPLYDQLGGTDTRVLQQPRGVSRPQGVLLRRRLSRAVPGALEGKNRARLGERPRDRLRGLAADAARADRRKGQHAGGH